MIKKLILLTSIIAVFAMACNKEESPMPDNTVEIESKDASIELRGGGLGPQVGIGPAGPVEVAYEYLSTVNSSFFITQNCNSNNNSFTLMGNSACNVLDIADVAWEYNNVIIYGVELALQLSASPIDITCTVYFESFKSQPFEISFCASIVNNHLIIGCGAKTEDVNFCGSIVDPDDLGGFIAIYP